jgi:uncharacterized delta-60 repeat protein
MVRNIAHKLAPLTTLLVFMFSLASAARAVVGDGYLDPYFQTGPSVNLPVNAVAVQNDGKILIGGAFSQTFGVPAIRIGRLNADGTVDTTFDAGLGFDRDVHDIVVQPDGKILVAGEFLYFDDQPCGYLVRLNPDGSRDPSFGACDGGPQWVPGFIHKIVLQPDGKILVGGNVRYIGGAYRSGIARLNADGTADATFITGTGTFSPPYVGEVYGIGLQSDGRIVIGGRFVAFNGVPRNRIARLWPDGSLDMSFSIPSSDGFREITSIDIQPDGKIVYGGLPMAGVTIFSGLRRANPDGSPDPGFVRILGDAGMMQQIKTQPDGRILVCTEFFLTRLLPNGEGDTSFNNEAGGGVNALALQPDGQIVIGGRMTPGTDANIYGAFPERVGRLSPTGQYDRTFAVRRRVGDERSVAVQRDGKIVTLLPAIPRITRRNKDGSPDLTFDPGAGGDDQINAFDLMSDGRIVVAGIFNKFNGVNRPALARLNPDGSLDSSFVPVAIGQKQYTAIRVQPDGKVIVAGDFADNRFRQAFGIARLLPDGSLDPAFAVALADPGDRSITAIELQADGKIIVGGAFRSIGGPELNVGVARLNADGSLDRTFSAGIGVNGSQFPFVTTVAIQPDGKILIGGTFLSYQGIVRGRIARINLNGSLDTSFAYQLDTVQPDTDYRVNDIKLQRDGKLLLAQANYYEGWTARSRLVRVTADGVLDPTFAEDLRYRVNKIALAPDGSVIAAGTEFSQAPWIFARRGLIRFLNPSQFAEPVNLSGRVTTPSGAALRNAVVTLVDSSGARRTAVTSSFGVFSFGSVYTNQDYTLTVASKRYRFAPRTVTVNGALSGIEMTGLE